VSLVVSADPVVADLVLPLEQATLLAYWARRPMPQVSRAIEA
jgi:hypothetical protein